MVVTRGPGLSIDAQGTIGDVVSFGSWKGRNYLRKKAAPTQPDNPSQVSFRAAWKFVAENWARMTTAQKDTWTQLGADLELPPFDAYMQFNASRWNVFQFASRYYPAEGPTFIAAFAAGYPKADAAENATHLQAKLFLNTINDKVCVFREVASPPPLARDLLVTIIPMNLNDLSTTYDRNLAPATYWYRFQIVGNWGEVRGFSYAGPVVIA